MTFIPEPDNGGVAAHSRLIHRDFLFRGDIFNPAGNVTEYLFGSIDSDFIVDECGYICTTAGDGSGASDPAIKIGTGADDDALVSGGAILKTLAVGVHTKLTLADTLLATGAVLREIGPRPIVPAGTPLIAVITGVASVTTRGRLYMWGRRIGKH